MNPAPPIEECAPLWYNSKRTKEVEHCDEEPEQFRGELDFFCRFPSGGGARPQASSLFSSHCRASDPPIISGKSENSAVSGKAFLKKSMLLFYTV